MIGEGSLCGIQVEKLVLAYIHRRLCEWRYAVYHPQHCDGRQCRCGARMPFGGVKVVLAGDFGQLPPVAVAAEKTLLHARPLQAGQSREEVNLGLRLFLGIKNVFRLRRIHRQVGQSAYKDSLLRVRDAAHTKEDVQLWQSHDLTSPSCALTPSERVAFEKERIHMFCETLRAWPSNTCQTIGPSAPWPTPICFDGEQSWRSGSTRCTMPQPAASSEALCP